MTRWIVVLSGPIRSGKTTLATKLSERFGLELIKTHDLIKSAYSQLSLTGRIPLQEYGEKLDRETKGRWVATELAKVILAGGADAAYIIDSARIPEQVDAIRLAFHPVTHIHLTADEAELRRRYEKQAAVDKDPVSYEDAKKNLTEKRVGRLAKIADIVIDTGRCTDEDVFVRATSRMSLYKHDRGYVDVLIGGQYGSEGKGQIASYLSREYDVIVRVGGPNAGHTVTDQSGSSFIYHQIPSGAMTNGAHVVLAPGMVVNVPKLLEEIAKCNLDFHRVSIDPKVMTISREDMKAEDGLFRRIGSTRQGVGAATSRRIMGRGLKSVVMAGDVKVLRPYVRPTYEVLFEALGKGKRILIEGTQGSGLSLYHGSYPHVTSRDTTVAGCLSEVGLSPRHVRRVIMVCRTYPIRVQDPPRRGRTSGPISREIDWGIVSQRSDIPREELEQAEITSTTKRKRRVGEFEWDLLRRSSFMNGPTDIALTFADYFTVKNRDAIRFEQLDDATIEFIEEVERVAGAPVSLISTGKGERHIIDRRSW
jgi:adenylosuccinate synthase